MEVILAWIFAHRFCTDITSMVRYQEDDGQSSHRPQRLKGSGEKIPQSRQHAVNDWSPSHRKQRLSARSIKGQRALRRVTRW
ncbi:hypothetical protein SISSUDRAFT_1048856 [Sistotremastrum suecicum HHB10207 ss-3]|uniref:Uncharacterized protein n=1 Tax=Sistotremastrum suecicum HHB10207 ss-3 TaxID=1314776 RepID=A0A166C8N7_9AGAM|nr:hypothetical protein SISSUDRAFT_1048856 [Sistotremastrum suecicum HHB10207 ss-3]